MDITQEQKQDIFNRLDNSTITELDGDKFVKANIFYNKEEGYYYPVIDKNGKTYVSLDTILKISQ